MRLFILSDPTCIHTKRWVSALSSYRIDLFLFGISGCNLEYYNQFDNVSTFAVDIVNERVKNGTLNKIVYLKVLKTLKRKIKEFKPDILHAHYASSYGLLGALSNFHPYVISVWGSDVYDFPRVSFFHKQLLKYNLLKADYLLSTSCVMAQETQKYTDKHISVTPFGVDVDLFYKRIISDVEDKEIVIGNVKALTPKYGIDILIKAFKKVVDDNLDKWVRLEIIGEGADKDNLKQLVVDLEIEDRVSFLGRIDNKLLPEYYNHFDIFVSTSVLDSESFGVVAVEAMACECPVVVSDADGFTEVVANQETGIIVPKRDVEATAKAIQKLIDNKDLRESMGKQGRKRVEELYDWKKNVELMISIYNDILSR